MRMLIVVGVDVLVQVDSMAVASGDTMASTAKKLVESALRGANSAVINGEIKGIHTDTAVEIQAADAKELGFKDFDALYFAAERLVSGVVGDTAARQELIAVVKRLLEDRDAKST
jgi:hypothetical protein